MSRWYRSKLFVRVVMSLAAGAAVAVVAFFAAFVNYRDHYLVHQNRFRSLHQLDSLEKQIQAYRKAAGRLPASLDDLEDMEEGGLSPSDREGRSVDRWFRLDSWSHPLQYTVDGDRFVLFSLGTDGRPGGEGSDADVYPTSANRPRQPLTLRQFAGTEVLGACRMSGIFTAFVCFWASREMSRSSASREFSRIEFREFVVQVAVTSIAATVVTAFLCVVDIPTGH